ncbi:J domain-containing protein [Desulfuromonas carbonis]|uniref:J domain-containing protein n=1 Tax=Desulfuromonas sp. DDH964 TaxID=1823759 RepID=UPI00078CCE62|nr:J domain-containing protein [Desulfuromonas sp. DDH964]AMV71172.1 DnaJ-like protein [Desulfuromonas sp. DDH964]
MNFQELVQALGTLELGERASLAEIRRRYHQLVRRHHPDAGGEDAAAIRRVNAAYQLLTSYCRNYRFSFSHEEFLEQFPEERLREQFSQDPVWGGGNSEG